MISLREFNKKMDHNKSVISYILRQFYFYLVFIIFLQFFYVKIFNLIKQFITDSYTFSFESFNKDFISGPLTLF